MQSPTDLEDPTGTIGVESFDATYGAGFRPSDDSPPPPSSASWSMTVWRSWRIGRPTRAAPAVVDGTVDGTTRNEARLTRTGPDGDVSMGLAGSWAAGALLVDGDEPARLD